MNKIVETVVLAFLVSMSSAYAETPREHLQILVAQLQRTPSDSAVREQVITFVRGMKQKPALPEEARGNFVKGAVFKDGAKTPSDYDLAISAYQQGLQAAPWDADAYYNLAVVQELATKYDDAIQSLKWSVMASPPGSKEAEEAQNHIYAIEAKKELSKHQESKQPAVVQEETIYITCHDPEGYDNKFTVDLAKNTINNKPATINATAIDWQEPLDWGGGNTRTDYGHIDRIAGTYTYTMGQMHFANGYIPTVPGPKTLSCTIGSAPPAKF